MVTEANAWCVRVRAVNLAWHSGANRGAGATEAGELRLRSLVQELLYTYRLIFSQDKASRRLFNKKLRGTVGKGVQDSLLDELCGTADSKFHVDRPELMTRLTRQSNCFQVSDLPHFGNRLHLIQEYMRKHRPNRLKDLYRDRRDREKFLTFWAVILFGSLAVVIGIVQTILSAAQFVISYKQWKSPQAVK